jgi:glutamate-1-semialdehyde 2,1-aminomutase
VMDAVAPEGHVFQAGTLSGNPLATAAALVVLRRLRDPQVYEQLEETAAALEDGLGHETVTVQRVGSMLTAFFRQGPVRNLYDMKASDRERYSAFFRHMLQRGVYLAPSPAEALFVSTAHGQPEVELTVDAAQEFLAR